MARIFFSDSSRNYYFSSLKKLSHLPWASLAQVLGISNRQLTDWRRGIYSLPESYAKDIESKFGLRLPTDITTKENNWHIQKAARLGGKRRLELYGPPGTPEGRRKGGLNSLKTHLRDNTGFKVSKTIIYPYKNEKLAEIIGALIGDGNMSVWQVRISLNMRTDRNYGYFLQELIEGTFGTNVNIFERKKYSALELIISSNRLVSFLKHKGLPIGDKIKQKLDIPKWINKRKAWQIACLRGQFDTDGCTYIDQHRYKEKVYRHIGLAFTSYSVDLLHSIKRILLELGYTPTISTKWRILLRKEDEVIRFFKEIKPSNNRHQDVLRKFLEEYRSGYNGTASKAVVAVRLP